MENKVLKEFIVHTDRKIQRYQYLIDNDKGLLFEEVLYNFKFTENAIFFEDFQKEVHQSDYMLCQDKLYKFKCDFLAIINDLLLISSALKAAYLNLIYAKENKSKAYLKLMKDNNDEVWGILNEKKSQEILGNLIKVDDTFVGASLSYVEENNQKVSRLNVSIEMIMNILNYEINKIELIIFLSTRLFPKWSDYDLFKIGTVEIGYPLIFSSNKADAIFQTLINKSNYGLSNAIFSFLYRQMLIDGYILSTVSHEDYIEWVEKNYGFIVSRIKTLKELSYEKFLDTYLEIRFSKNSYL